MVFWTNYFLVSNKSLDLREKGWRRIHLLGDESTVIAVSLFGFAFTRSRFYILKWIILSATSYLQFEADWLVANQKVLPPRSSLLIIN